jgi:8-oxo-dGTP diphosphatase
MARENVVAAGGILVQRGPSPLIAVVQMRKRGDWVLPKGKLDPGETPRAAAQREVLEETGHVATVHEFLGTLVYPLGERFKIVHFWRMETGAEPTRKLMKDIVAVDWLPLDKALVRLSRDHEQAFLAEVGPLALASAEGAGVPTRREEPATIPQNSQRGVLQRLWRWLAA